MIQTIRSAVGRLINKFRYRHFAHFGKNVNIGKNLIADDVRNISIGDHSSIGPNCVLYAGIAPLVIGRYVVTGPNVSIITGDHRADVIGYYMLEVSAAQKLPENDAPVVIEDDVWIGCGVIILKGVKIGRGSIIAAGAVVTKSVEPYTIFINSQKQLRRFTDEQIIEHEILIHDRHSETV